MSIGYLFDEAELDFFVKLFGTGGVCARQTKDFEEREREAAKRLERKRYLSMKDGVLYVEPAVRFFFDILREAEVRGSSFETENGVFYEGKDGCIFLEPDSRRLAGFCLRPYPSLETWYEEEERPEKSLDDYRKELHGHG